MKLLYTFLCLLLGTCCYGQGALKGRATQTAGTVAPNVNITLQGTNFSTSTDDNGDFHIFGIPSGSYTLRASGFNYAEQTTTVKITDGKT